MCFSVSANFVGSAVLGAMPCLFALHQFTEGFVWLGLDGHLWPIVAHDAGAAYVLYAQGLLPFPLPLSVFLIEPTRDMRRRMLDFATLGGALALYILWGLRRYEFTSIGCAYAAVIGVVVYFFFRRSREGRPADYATEAAL